MTARIDTPEELVAFRHGGILPFVLRQLLAQSKGYRMDDVLRSLLTEPGPTGNEGTAAAAFASS